MTVFLQRCSQSFLRHHRQFPNRRPHHLPITRTTDEACRFFSSEPKKVAIVGSGPSGFYTAKYLQSTWNSSSNNKNGDDDVCLPPRIDILERLPTAYGLVRNGVAPDHPEVKNVQNDFDKLMLNESLSFFGNVHVGQDVSLQELRELYDIVILAYGCESNRSMFNDNDDSSSSLKRILSAREFVNWYNGHIEFQWVGDIVQDALNASPSDNGKVPKNNIVVIGHGNVALDCARILAKDQSELDPTDITTSSLNVISSPSDKQQQGRNIAIVGRRGHVQAAFTIKEVRELTKLPNANFIVLEDELAAGKSSEASQQELKDSRPKGRIDKLLTKHATTASKQEEEDPTTNVHLRFLMNPIRFESDDGTNVARVICERTELTGEAGNQKAQGTGVEEALPADLVLVSIGYKGLAIPGTEQWYDDASGTLSNTHGVVDAPTSSLAGLYVSGWLKRGPSGIIGTNIADAKDTVASIVKDFATANNRDDDNASSLGGVALKDLLNERGVQVVEWSDYKKIEAAEMDDKRKRHPDQPRVKFTTRQELLQAAAAPSS